MLFGYIWGINPQVVNGLAAFLGVIVAFFSLFYNHLRSFSAEVSIGEKSLIGLVSEDPGDWKLDHILIPIQINNKRNVPGTIDDIAIVSKSSHGSSMKRDSTYFADQIHDEWPSNVEANSFVKNRAFVPFTVSPKSGLAKYIKFSPENGEAPKLDTLGNLLHLKVDVYYQSNKRNKWFPVSQALISFKDPPDVGFEEYADHDNEPFKFTIEGKITDGDSDRRALEKSSKTSPTLRFYSAERINQKIRSVWARIKETSYNATEKTVFPFYVACKYPYESLRKYIRAYHLIGHYPWNLRDPSFSIQDAVEPSTIYEHISDSLERLIPQANNYHGDDDNISITQTDSEDELMISCGRTSVKIVLQSNRVLVEKSYSHRTTKRLSIKNEPFKSNPTEFKFNRDVYVSNYGYIRFDELPYLVLDFILYGYRFGF